MKTKTVELVDEALDRAVARCEALAWDEYDFALDAGLELPSRPSEYLRDSDFDAGFAPSTDWSQGGPIIAREFIEFGVSSTEPVQYAAKAYVNDKRVIAHGPTHLIAAMRCYVLSRLGSEV